MNYMNYNEQKKQIVKDFLMNLSDSVVLSLNDDMDADYIFENTEETLNELFENPSDAVRAAMYGDYRYTDDYFRFDGNENLESANYLSDLIDFDEMVDYVINDDPSEIHDDLENTLIEEFSRLFSAEHPNTDIEDRLDDYDIIGENWDNLAIELEKELHSDSDDDDE